MLMTMVNGGSVDQGEKRDTCQGMVNELLEEKKVDLPEWIRIGEIANSTKVPSDCITIYRKKIPLTINENGRVLIDEQSWARIMGCINSAISDSFNPEVIALRINKRGIERPDDNLGEPANWKVVFTVDIISDDVREG